MKKCPKCGCKEFYVTAHVAQDWLVDRHGNYLKTENECAYTIHKPDNDDMWMCADCGYHADGKEFEVKEEI